MAAAGPYPAMPAPVRLARTDNVYPKQNRPFDAKLLIIKLEAARLQQIITARQETARLENARAQNARQETARQAAARHESVRQKSARRQKEASKAIQPPPIKMTTITAPTNKRASYVPRNAAKHFAATTTPMPAEATQDLKRARSTKERVKPDFHPESMPTVNPKQLTAALSLGMSESEVSAAAVAAEAGAEPKAASHLTVPAANHRKANRQSRVVRTATEENRLRSKAPSQSPESAATAEQVHVMSSYRPGDAAKRAAERRKSQVVYSQGKLITVNQGGAITQHREYTLEFSDPKRTEIPDPFDSAVTDDNSHHVDSHHVNAQHHDVVHRPALKPHDRHNWAQESQCGDEMRHHHLLRPHFGRRKSSKTSSDREDARQALEGGSSSLQRPSGPVRHKSADTLPDTQALVSDAVRQIKKEEKAKRHQSIVGFFRRL